MSTQPIVRVSQRVPENQRDWEEFLRKLNTALRTDGERAVLGALTTIAERTGTDLGTLATYLSDAGRATDQRLLPMVNFGNISSVQSVDPLTASSGATTADITVSAHTLHTDFGNIAYNGGAVTGLSLNTRYYVTASDPNYAGGAVTYTATTSRPNVPANSGLYFVGTITTPAAANTVNITAATSANPPEFTTATNHGWSTADNSLLAALPGDFGTNLNGTTQSITVTAPDKFTVPVNATLYAAYTTGGTATRVVVDTTPDFGGGAGGFIP